MTRSTRWAAVILLGLGLLAIRQTDGPPALHAQPPADTTPQTAPDAVSLPTERQALRKLRNAEDFIKLQSWTEAIRILQTLLDAKEDVFLPVEREERQGARPVHWLSARSEAVRLLSTLPRKGLEDYQVTYGDQAQGRLGDALKSSDAATMDDLARRYFFTRAGLEAAAWLATQHLDRGRYDAAASCLARLLLHPDADKLAPLTLFHAALAFRRTGDAGREEQAWKRLKAQAAGGLLLGGRTVALAELRQELDRVPRQQLADWPLFRGDPARGDAGLGDTPLLEPRWQAGTISQPLTRTRISQAIAHLRATSQPIMPAFFPIAAGERLIYRSYSGLHAVDVHTGRPAWPSPVPLGLSLDALLGDLGGPKQQLTSPYPYPGWWERYAFDWSILFENATIGSLSTDGRHVYAVEDLPLPPHPTLTMELQPGIKPAFSKLGPYVNQNQLKAFRLDDGAPVWTLGGLTTGAKGEVAPPLADSYFLGPPLPLMGYLFVLVEKKGEQSVVCLDPERGEVLWTQPIASANENILTDVGRRIHGAHLAYADGVLVCPTNAGAIVAIDPFTRNLLWAHLYRDKIQPMAPEIAASLNGAFVTMSWKASAPVIRDGQVVFTAADGDTLRCLNLRDGSLVWKTNRLDDDRYLAGVYQGKVLVAGRSACRALDLKDGSEVWHQRTGFPSGQGVASGNLYYLPLARGGVAVLDLTTGKETSFIECRGKDVPGNLLFHQGTLISQNVAGVAVYPQLRAELKRMDEALAKSPNDPAGLTERGRYRLDQGDLSGAVADLRAALANQPRDELRAKARDRLYEALTRLCERDFNQAERYLGDFRALCELPVPADAKPDVKERLREETRRRQIRYGALVARGREAQGRPLDALDAYQGLYALAGDDRSPHRLGDDAVEQQLGPWIAGRVADLIEGAAPVQRALLERRIEEQWRDLRARGDVEALTRFVALLSDGTTAGREARLLLAERLMEKPDGLHWLEAEQLLLRLARRQEEPALAARAVEALARLMMHKGLIDDAFHYYRKLGHEFAGVVVRDGKTGAQLLADLARDKRFQAFAVDARPAWEGRKIQVTETQGNYPFAPTQVTFEFEGDLTPSVRRQRLVLDLGTSQLKLQDAGTGANLWSHTLSLGGLSFLYQQLFSQSGWRLPCQVKGHVAVVNLGPVVYAIDLVGRRLLWQRTLPGSQANPQVTYTGDMIPALMYGDGWVVKVGPTGPPRLPQVCLQTRQGLLALDAVRGEVLWQRDDLATQVELFGDQDFLSVVELRGDGGYGATRALRGADGRVLRAADFADLYVPARRLAVVGRDLLLVDREEDKPLRLRLYDVRTGKDVWQREFPAKSVVASTMAAQGLLVVIEPTGRLTLFDLNARRELWQAALDPRHLEKADQANLFRDRSRYYLALKGPADNKVIMGDAYPFWQGTVRSVPVNGMLYAFDRETGRVDWYHALTNQIALTEQLDDSPVLLFTAAYNRAAVAGGAGGQVMVFATKSIDKRTGKLVYNKEILGNFAPFHTLQVDAKTGTVDLISGNLRIRHAPARER